MFPTCWNIYNSSYLQRFNNKWKPIFYYFLEMNGCNVEGNLLSCNKYCPELGNTRGSCGTLLLSLRGMALVYAVGRHYVRRCWYQWMISELRVATLICSLYGTGCYKKSFITLNEHRVPENAVTFLILGSRNNFSVYILVHDVLCYLSTNIIFIAVVSCVYVRMLLVYFSVMRSERVLQVETVSQILLKEYLR